MRHPIHLASFVVALVLVVTACNDDAAETTTTAVATTSTTVATTTTIATTTTEAGPDLEGLLTTFRATPIRTTYRFGEGTDQTEVTMSQDPTAATPQEAILIPDAHAKLITSGDETIFCDTAAGTCFEVPGTTGDSFSAGLLGPFAGGLFIAGRLDSIPGATLSEEPITVAGRDGTCFTFSPPAETGFDTDLIRQCIDQELGFTLLIQTVPAGAVSPATVMELIEFGAPLPDDFTPTGPITTGP